MKTVSTNSKKMILAKLEEGEDLLNAILKCAEENNIKSGYVTGIGGLSEASFGVYQNGGRKLFNKKADAKSCLEIVSIAGNITIQEGKPLAHIHLSISDMDGNLVGGHLVEGSKIFPFVELFMMECDKTIVREYDSKTNLWPINI